MTDHLIIYSDRGLSIQKWPVHRTKTRPSCRISPLGMEHPAQAKRPNSPQTGWEAGTAGATLEEVCGYRPLLPSLVQLCSAHSSTHSEPRAARQHGTGPYKTRESWF